MFPRSFDAVIDGLSADADAARAQGSPIDFRAVREAGRVRTFGTVEARCCRLRAGKACASEISAG